jgi:hypothetical protein
MISLVKLNYFWTDCADGSHVAVNYTVYEDRVSGSVRRWSRDRSTNIGRKFEVSLGDLGRDVRGVPALRFDGICEGEVLVPLDEEAMRQAGMSWNRAA